MKRITNWFWINSKFTRIYSNGNQENLEFIQNQFVILFNNVLPTGVQKVGLSNLMQDKLYDICINTDTVAACNKALYGLCLQYNKDSAYGNSNVANFCGCHLPDNIYAIYSSLYGIDKSCDPLCARKTTIQETYYNGKQRICLSNVCIIDNINITLTNSSNGEINFYQACGGCSFSNQCNCYITNVDINLASSSLGDVKFEQVCKGNLDCYGETETGIQKINCNSSSSNITLEEAEYQKYVSEKTKKIQKNGIILLIILFIVSFVFLALILFGNLRSRPKTIYNYQYK